MPEFKILVLPLEWNPSSLKWPGWPLQLFIAYLLDLILYHTLLPRLSSFLFLKYNKIFSPTLIFFIAYSSRKCGNQTGKLIKKWSIYSKMILISRNKYLTMDEFNRGEAKKDRTSEYKEISGKYSLKRERNGKYDRAVEVQCIEWEAPNSSQNIWKVSERVEVHQYFQEKVT